MSARWSRAQKHHHGRPAGQLVGEMLLSIVRTVLWVGFTAAGTALNMWAAVVLLLLFPPSDPWGYLAASVGAAIAGAVGGGIIGFGQVLTLRRWLDTAASLGSFFSTILASSSALIAGTLAGWWVHTAAGDLGGAFAGVVVYGLVFGLIQRPMLDYMSRYSGLWVPLNAIAAVLGAIAVLAAFDVSGGRRDMLQFRYAGLVYSLVVGVAFLWMTRETRKAMSNRRTTDLEPRDDSGSAPHAIHEVRKAELDPTVLEIHEHRIYSVLRVADESKVDSERNAAAPSHLPDKNPASFGDEKNSRDVIDTTYRVIS